MAETFLSVRGVSKSFNGVTVLRDIDFDLALGEIRALVGENGAGKSTFIKIIAGVLHADEGSLSIQGVPVRFNNPREALKGGVSVIYQELDLVPNLDGITNIFLGFERFRRGMRGFLDKKAMHEIARKTLARLEVDIDLTVPVNRLPVAEQQILAICKSLVHEARLIIMDEPSATLSGNELEHLYRLIRTLKEQGITIIYISHRLEEIFKIADKVSVLRDGCHVATVGLEELDKERLVSLMIGHNLEERRINTRDSSLLGDTILELSDVGYSGKLRDISFSVRRGEIFGVLGLVGSGRNELAKILYGMIPPDRGDIYVKGKKARLRNPLEAIRKNLSYVPDDRKAHGILPNLSVETNIVFSVLYRLVNWVFMIKRKLVRELYDYYQEKLNIRVNTREQVITELSGGNQQKCVLSKCLARANDIIILNEPTRGIDVGAKFEIYQILLHISQEGKTLVVFSSELPELTNLCDRVLVLKKGAVSSIHDSSDLDQEKILSELLV
jgi:ribose transport system ATP-binding protein